MAHKKKHKPQKPNPKIKVKRMQDTEGLNTGFGEYDEYTGGGHPFKAGDSNTRTTRENGKLREQENAGKTEQPRTGDGKFTYKSVNGQSIDPKYGPSRGVTVPPTLTGGENGIKIADVERDFKAQSGAYWDKYKDKWYNVGGMVVTKGLSTKVSRAAVWHMAQEYDKTLGQYRMHTKDGMKYEDEQWENKGAGRPTQDERSAKDAARKTKQQQNVMDSKSGGIKTKPGGPSEVWTPKNRATGSKPRFRPKPNPNPNGQTQGTGPNPNQNPNNGGQQKQPVNPQPSAGGAGISQSRYSQQQFDEAKDFLSNQMGLDLSGLSVSEIDDLIDKYVEF